MKAMKRGGESGFTLVESMVAMGVGVAILTASFHLFIEESKTYQNQIQISEMRQNARTVTEFMSRDLISAGYNLGDSNGSIPAIVCNEPTVTDAFLPTAVTIHSSPSDIRTALSFNMPQSSAELKVVSTAGFEEGMRIAIWDEVGHFQWIVITAVQTSASHLQHNTTSLNNPFTKENGTQLGVIDELAYRYVASDMRVERQVNGGDWIAIAENVLAFNLRYFKNNGTEITPDSSAERSEIRKVRIELRARTTQKDRRTRGYPQYSINTEVAPRNLPYLPG